MTPLHSVAGKGLLWCHSRIDYRILFSWTPYHPLDHDHGFTRTRSSVDGIGIGPGCPRGPPQLRSEPAASSTETRGSSGHAGPGRERPETEPSGFAHPHGRRVERRYGGERPLLCGQAPGHVPSRWRLLPVTSGCLLQELLQPSAGKISRAFQQKYPDQFSDGPLRDAAARGESLAAQAGNAQAPAGQPCRVAKATYRLLQVG